VTGFGRAWLRSPVLSVRIAFAKIADRYPRLADEGERNCVQSGLSTMNDGLDALGQISDDAKV
jgi:hypothetical protein